MVSPKTESLKKKKLNKQKQSLNVGSVKLQSHLNDEEVIEIWATSASLSEKYSERMASGLGAPLLFSLNQGQDLDEDFVVHTGISRGIDRSLAPNRAGSFTEP